MNEYARQLLDAPALVMRRCGFPLLTDELHGQWMRQMLLGREDMTLLAHRGSYKTTCVAGVLAIRCVLMGSENTFFIRKTDDDVKEIILQTRKILESDYMRALTFRMLGGKAPIWVKKCTATQLTCTSYRSPRGGPQLLGLGIGGSLTGKHADCIFTDDIVNLSDRVSRASREATRAAYMELQNVRNRGGRIVNTGTPWHKEDAISTLMPAPLRFDCYATGLIPPDKLQEIRQSMSASLFAANYELRHIAEASALFPEAPRFQPEPRLLYDGIAHVDAAYGGEDCTALTCARRRGGVMHLYGRLWPKHVDACLDDILAECERLRCAPIYCETNGDKGYLSREMRARGAITRPYPEKQNKYLKISTYLRKWWKNIVFLEGTDPEYLSQIQDYTDCADHDDAPDSAACVCRALDRRE